jgi:ABC-2 type transport system permease protein/lipopolysaccharide transport system permease protein
MWFLAVRDVRVRYKQALLGAAWGVVQPLVAMGFMTLVFHRFAKVQSGDIPYPLFALTGLLTWSYFSSAVSGASESLVVNEALVTKVYFPRIIAPLSSLLPPFTDAAVGLVLFAVSCLVFGFTPDWHLVLLPLWVIALLIVSLAVGIPIAALHVRYRDVRHAIGPALQAWLFLSPVAYPVTLVHVTALYDLNPMVGVIDLGRTAFTGARLPMQALVESGCVVVVLLAYGLWYFRRTEQSFADVI